MPSLLRPGPLPFIANFLDYAIADGIFSLLYPDKTVLQGIQPNGLSRFKLCFDFGWEFRRLQVIFSVIFFLTIKTMRYTMWHNFVPNEAFAMNKPENVPDEFARN